MSDKIILNENDEMINAIDERMAEVCADIKRFTTKHTEDVRTLAKICESKNKVITPISIDLKVKAGGVSKTVTMGFTEDDLATHGLVLQTILSDVIFQHMTKIGDTIDKLKGDIDKYLIYKLKELQERVEL